MSTTRKSHPEHVHYYSKIGQFFISRQNLSDCQMFSNTNSPFSIIKKSKLDNASFAYANFSGLLIDDETTLRFANFTGTLLVGAYTTTGVAITKEYLLQRGADATFVATNFEEFMDAFNEKVIASSQFMQFILYCKGSLHQAQANPGHLQLHDIAELEKIMGHLDYFIKLESGAIDLQQPTPPKVTSSKEKLVAAADLIPAIRLLARLNSSPTLFAGSQSTASQQPIEQAKKNPRP